jgi:hypothetical protein
MKKDDPLNAISESFFTFMLANAILNVIYSFAFLLYYSISCAQILLDFMDSNDNCQELDKWMWTVTSVLKVMANFSFLLISLNRYLFVGKDHATWVKTVAKTYVKTTTFLAFVCSCLLSVVTYFQINTFSSGKHNIKIDNGGQIPLYSKYNYHHVYNLHYHTEQIELMLNQLTSTLPIVIGFVIVRDFFSYFLFCIFNLAIDVMTVNKLKESMAEKAKLSSLNKRDEQMRAERRCVLMVVLNSLVNVLLRLPELLAIVFYIIVETNSNGLYVFKMLCFTYNQCQTLNDIANPFYIISLSTNVIFFYFSTRPSRPPFFRHLACV